MVIIISELNNLQDKNRDIVQEINVVEWSKSVVTF